MKEGKSVKIGAKETFFMRFLQLKESGVLLALIVLIVFLGLYTDTFLTVNNILDTLRAVSFTGIAAIGQLMVILTGGLDLSVGSVMAMAGIVVAFLLNHLCIPLAIIISMFIGVLVGFVNGLFVNKTEISPVIVTLAMLSIVRGLAFALSGGMPIGGMPSSFINLGVGKLLGIPIPILFFIIIGLLTHTILSKTAFGYHLYATGGNPTAARYSGVNTHNVKYLAYVFSGVMGVIGGILLTARIGVAQSSVAQGYELDIIAAVVIGGASLNGGVGTVAGTIFGAIIMGIIRNGLVLMNISPYWHQAVSGMMILIAVLLNQARLSKVTR
jgi:ribose transport system permease protein